MRVVMLVAVLLMARTVTAQPIERINPPGLSMPTTYSHIVKVGSILYIAGQVGADAQGKVVGPRCLPRARCRGRASEVLWRQSPGEHAGRRDAAGEP